MVTGAAPNREHVDFRQEALVEERDGTLYLTLHGFNDNEESPFHRPFDPHGVNGLDDGDPHYV